MTVTDEEIQSALKAWVEAKEGDSNDAEHDTAGLVIDLLLDRLGIECPEPTKCRFCGDSIHRVDDVWVDDTDGDACSGDIVGINENESHRP